MINRLFSQVFLLILLNTAIVRSSPIIGRTDTDTEISDVILTGNETPLQGEGSASSQEHESPVLIKDSASSQDSDTSILPMGPASSWGNGPHLQMEGSASFENNVTPILIDDLTPSMERVTPLHKDLIQETVGSADGGNIRIPDNRMLRSFSPEDMKVLSSFISWMDSNGLGSVESRFGRSVSKTKRPRKYLQTDGLKRLARKFNKQFLPLDTITWKKALRHFHWRMNNKNK